jgi:hypothetical protein
VPGATFTAARVILVEARARLASARLMHGDGGEGLMWVLD